MCQGTVCYIFDNIYADNRKNPFAQKYKRLWEVYRALGSERHILNLFR
jgi:hypothetical protein